MTNDNYNGGDLQANPMRLEGLVTGDWYGLNPVTYSMKLTYHYTNNSSEAIQVRVYSRSAPGYWLPYCD
ncbi:DUF7154 domain-containing protein [Caenorhabditis elegans]|uniref:DUF7154 domain-containing protein n=1 Tax=Caenorhabditis elegans TaxID=6239 RepID=I2HAC4_CAEEL|nr:CARDB domain-containing protein [Caenorhabditis elegans]CCH63831.1 CARDB domain-containing protein [Caenorhabditis elegans]|eukprot:NP_001255229.1 Uncharacterized protein CELE_Y55F3AM.21 [Caenorhabditis elegans]